MSVQMLAETMYAEMEVDLVKEPNQEMCVNYVGLLATLEAELLL